MNMSTEAEQKLSSMILRMNNLKMANSELVCYFNCINSSPLKCFV